MKEIGGGALLATGTSCDLFGLVQTEVPALTSVLRVKEKKPKEK